MAKYVLLDQGAARDRDFQAHYTDPQTRILIPDIYLCEMTKASADIVDRQFNALKPVASRVFITISAENAEHRERSELRRVKNGGGLVTSRETIAHRNGLLNGQRYADFYVSKVAIEHVEARINHSDRRRNAFRGSVEKIGRGLRDKQIIGKPNDELDIDYLIGAIHYARKTVFDRLCEDGHAHDLACTFSNKDSFLFRHTMATVCRILDWGTTSGMNNLQDVSLDNDINDIEYVTVGSYFDELLTKENRNLRHDGNLRRALNIAPGNGHSPVGRIMAGPG